MAGRPSNDDKLIKENPEKTPKQLLTLGLSQAGYEKLTEHDSELPTLKTQPTVEAKTPVAPTVVQENKRAVPQMQEYKASPNPAGMVVLISPDGTRTPMTDAAAKRFKRGGRNANYQIEA